MRFLRQEKNLMKKGGELLIDRVQGLFRQAEHLTFHEISRY